MELRKFENEMFGALECFTDENNEPWFVGYKVAAALGYSSRSKAVQRHVDTTDVKKMICEVPEQHLTSEDQDCGMSEQSPASRARKTQTVTFINESGLYSLILASKLPQAKQFKRWITGEVLPAIRNTGGYVPVREDDDETSIMAKAVMIAQNTLQRLRERNEQQRRVIEAQTEQMSILTDKVAELQSKVSYLDDILQCKATVLVTQIAQDYGMSARNFNKLLETHGIQRKIHGQWVLHSKYLAEGYVHSRSVIITHNDGHQSVKLNTEWTQRGRVFLYEFLKSKDILPLIEC